MDYRQSIAYLFSLQRFGIKLGLSNITTLLKHLGNPHQSLRCIHIAGTNGKGSTAAFLQSILKHSGYRAGLFTSPHLVSFTERIRINDREIQRGRVARLVHKIRALCRQNSLETITFFEFVTALALAYFAEEEADPVVVEVGMGGRLDATNILQPMVSIITSISLEHQIYLGTTLQRIAKEKAGIIKRCTPLIAGVRQPSVIAVMREKCRQMKATLFLAGKDVSGRKTGPGMFDYKGFDRTLTGLLPGLIGDHQIRNATLALGAAELLCRNGFNITEQGMRTGIQEARWPGRMEIVRRTPAVVLDGAHNPEAWQAIKKTLNKYFTYKKLFMVIGVMQDKDIARMIEILTPGAHTVIFCKPKMERAAPQETIAQHSSRSAAKNTVWIDDTVEALHAALKRASADDLVCVTGSLFTVGEAREYLVPATGIATGRIPL
jgi:dihydrofolate synthase/folylpolyglutamate synthase